MVFSGQSKLIPHENPRDKIPSLKDVAGHPFMDLLPIDVSDLPDPTAARYGEMVTLIGGEIGIDDFAAAIRSTGREVLNQLGSRFHPIYLAICQVRNVSHTAQRKEPA